jgi:hypothetical protein
MKSGNHTILFMNYVMNSLVLRPSFTFYKFYKSKIMKTKSLYSVMLIAGLLLVNFSVTQVYGQKPQKETVKQQSIMYACSMHPEIVQDHPGNCSICGMKLVEKKDKEKGEMHHAHDSTMMKKNHMVVKHDSTMMKKDNTMHDSINMKKGKMMNESNMMKKTK